MTAMCLAGTTRAVVLAILACLIFSALAAAQSNVRTVQGTTVRVTVPMVSEPWSATAGLAAPVRRKRPVFQGHYPGYRAAKREANQRAMEQRARRGLKAEIPGASFAAQRTASTVFDGPDEPTSMGAFPPDSQIAVGPSDIVAVINGWIAIYHKDGISFFGLSLFNFFQNLGLTGQIFDPRILYDQTDGRYILTAAEVDLTNLTNGNVLIAVSDTSDPSRTWHKWAVNFMGKDLTNTVNTFPDFPSVGISSSALYITSDQYELNQTCVNSTSSPCQFSDTWLKVIGLSGLLSGSSTLAITSFTDVLTSAKQQAFAIMPALTYGPSNTEFLVAADLTHNSSTILNLFSIPATGTPTLSAGTVTVPSYSYPPDAQQEGSSGPILTNDDGMLNAVWSNGVLYCGQNAASSDGSAVVAQWYEVNVTSLASASLGQSGSVSGAGDAYYPAISIEADGSVDLAFTTSSSNNYASAAFASRAPADPAGTMSSYAIYKAGFGSYDETGGSRWGDYSGISPDPAGGMWLMAEYAEDHDPRFGTSIAQLAGAPEVSLSPASLDFGSVVVGSTSKEQTVTVANNGTTAIAISSITASSGFAVAADSTCPISGGTLAAGASCTIGLTFSPTTFGSVTGTVTVTDNATSGTTQTISLQGTGYSGAVSLNPSSLSFGNQLVGATSATKNVTLTNSGSQPLTISAINPPPGDYSVSSNCPLSPSTLAAGASCQVSVAFAPTWASMFAYQITIADSASDSPQTLPVSGTGIAPAVTFNPTSLTFGAQLVGTTSQPQSVTLSNTGTADLTISSLTAEGNTSQPNSANPINNSPFSETDNCPRSPSTIPPGGSCTVTVTALPTAWGSLGGGIQAINNAPGSPQFAGLSGTAYSGTGSISPSTLTLNAPAVGQTGPPGTVTVTNTGSSPLFITEIGGPGGGFGETNDCPMLGSGLPAGESCTVTLTYKPTQIGSLDGGLLIVDSSSSGFDQSLTIYGTTGSPDFAIAGYATSLSILPGQSASYSVTVSPLGGSKQTVALGCSGAPSKATCAVSPTSVALDGTKSQNVTVTVTTAAAADAPPAPMGGPPIDRWPVALWFAMLALAAGAKLRRSHKGARPCAPTFVLAATLLFVALWAGCGGGGSSPPSNAGTPAGTYTLRVTGTAGGVSHSVNLTLTVQ